ncbi:MAG TPA: hypothetical protein DD640_07090 [Clostridiales bacterium]|nr:hypothetical protein [Clostridiales bacterium]
MIYAENRRNYGQIDCPAPTILPAERLRRTRNASAAQDLLRLGKGAYRMNNESYSRNNELTDDGAAADGQYLQINCTGICAMNRSFTTYRPQGRRDYYLLFMDRGTLEVIREGQPQVIQPGHLVIFHPGETQWYVKHDDSEMVYYWIHFTGYGVPEVLSGCGLAAAGIYYTGPRQDITEAFREIFQNFIGRDSCYETAAAAQLLAILVRIRRSIDELECTRRGLIAGRLKASLNYIHSQYNRPISVRELAELEHLSPSRYCWLFRQQMGLSPHDFIIDLRLRMAADLMAKTDLSLKQIAHMVGYDDQLYFSRLFRSKRGLAPKHYAQSLLNLMDKEQ